ncbi:MAG: hypothetical protein HY825_10830 [Acidobacteria bacterium]|nr:hypothetical protein [Acidobacteriota bacterium]
MSVDSWAVDATLWRRWAVPFRGGAPAIADAVVFDSGRRAGAVGEPAPELRAGEAELDDARAEEVVSGLLAGWRPELHRSAALGLVSEIGEPRDAFRRRCQAALGEAVRGGALQGDAGVATVQAVRASIETRVVEPAAIELLAARVGIGWFGAADQPGEADGELMIAGQVRTRR